MASCFSEQNHHSEDKWNKPLNFNSELWILEWMYVSAQRGHLIWIFCGVKLWSRLSTWFWGIFYLNWEKHTKENHFYSSSDSDSEDDEPRRFHVEIKPVQPNNSSQYTMPSLDELKVSIGNITLSPAASVSFFVPCIFNV